MSSQIHDCAFRLAMIGNKISAKDSVSANNVVSVDLFKNAVFIVLKAILLGSDTK